MNGYDRLGTIAAPFAQAKAQLSPGPRRIKRSNTRKTCVNYRDLMFRQRAPVRSLIEENHANNSTCASNQTEFRGHDALPMLGDPAR